MVQLGVGKNMVRAIRFWADASDIAIPSEPPSSGLRPSQFGEDLLGPKGHDEYLEDIKTLWLIHWKISTNVQQPLFAWDRRLNLWHRPDFTRTEVISVFAEGANRQGKSLSSVTLDTHFSTFLHTYIPTRGKKGEVVEDNLDCPLTELNLITQVGERSNADSNRREPIYAFRMEDKPEISPELFIYCVNDFWENRHKNEKTLPFREISVGHGSPGQILKLPEASVRDRLESARKDSGGIFEFQESTAIQQLVRLKPGESRRLLKNIYPDHDRPD